MTKARAAGSVENGASHKALVAGDHLWPSYRALVGTGLSCAVLIVLVYVATKPIIDEKRLAQLEAAIFKVLPGATSKKDFYVLSSGELVSASSQTGAGLNQNPTKLYAGYDENGYLTGIAISAQGMGYQDTIRVLYGYRPQSQTISGLQVLDSKETPGLGDKIEKDPNFVANFKALDVSLSKSGSDLANVIIAVKNGEKHSPWQIDGITGATISSDAIASILQYSASALLPVLYPEQAWIQELNSAPNNLTTNKLTTKSSKVTTEAFKQP